MKKLHQQYHFRTSDQGLLAWDVSRLVRLSKDLPAFEKSVSEISELNESYWFSPDEEATCIDIIRHTKQINEADLSYPVILCSEGKVMDGMHRICKAVLEGRETISAVQFEHPLEPDYIGKKPDELPY